MHITLTFTEEEGDKILKAIELLERLDDLGPDIRYLCNNIEQIVELLDGRNQDNAG